MSPFSMGAASGGVFWLSDYLQGMSNRVVPAAAHEDHALADTRRSPATVLLHNGVIHSDFILIFILLLI